MDDKERKEYIEMLKARKGDLTRKVIMRRAITLNHKNKELFSDYSENSLIAQIEEINTKLFLLGQ